MGRFVHIWYTILSGGYLYILGGGLAGQFVALAGELTHVWQNL